MTDGRSILITGAGTSGGNYTGEVDWTRGTECYLKTAVATSVTGAASTIPTGINMVSIMWAIMCALNRISPYTATPPLVV